MTRHDVSGMWRRVVYYFYVHGNLTKTCKLKFVQKAFHGNQNMEWCLFCNAFDDDLCCLLRRNVCKLTLDNLLTTKIFSCFVPLSSTLPLTKLEHKIFIENLWSLVGIEECQLVWLVFQNCIIDFILEDYLLLRTGSGGGAREIEAT